MTTQASGQGADDTTYGTGATVGAVLLTVVMPVIALSSATSGVAGCKGGIDECVPPSYVSSDGVHWQATYSCMNGGTQTRSVPDSHVPGG